MGISKKGIFLSIILSLFGLFFFNSAYAWTLRDETMFKSSMGICIYVFQGPREVLIATLTRGRTFTCVGPICNTTTIYVSPSKGNRWNAFCPASFYEGETGCIQENVTSASNIVVVGGGSSLYGDSQSLHCGTY